MTQTHWRIPLSRLPIRNIALGLACTSLTLACTPEYPLGDLTHRNLPLADGATTAASVRTVPDGTVSPLLGAPDVTFGLNDIFGDPNPYDIVSVGDLDGDGLPDLAVFASDGDTGVNYVQIRYGVPRPTDATQAFAFGQSGAYLVEESGGSSPGIVMAAGDVDGDGYDDMLIDTGHCSQPQPWEGTFLVYGGPERLSGAQPLSAAAVNFPLPARGGAEPSDGYTCGAFNSFVSGDFDGDGFSDLVFVNPPVIGATVNGVPVPDDFENGGLYFFYGRSQRFTSATSWTSADAHVTTSGNVLAAPVLDANGDGLPDLIIGSSFWERSPSPTYWLPGSHERLSGTVALAAHATELLGVKPYASIAYPLAPPTPIGDLDGDGLGDVLLIDENAQAYLFYGAPDLFQNGADLEAAAATFPPDPRAGLQAFPSPAPFTIIPAGDRDGDGDSELALLFSVPGAGVTGVQTNVVLLSGQRQRLSGSVSFPIDELLADNPAPRFDPATDRYLTNVFPAGDLDGDGATDLFTVSQEYVSEDGGYTMTAPQLHIHYGTPVATAPAADAPR